MVTMLYYNRLVDPMMLRAINETLRVQAKPTNYTEEKSIFLLDYVETYPNAIIRYKASNMFLHVDS